MTHHADRSIEDFHTGRSSDGDDVLNIISGVQSELDRLKVAQRRQAEEQAALTSLRRELEARSESLDQRQTELESAREALSAQSESLDSRQAEIDRVSQELATATAAAQEHTRTIAERRTSLDEEVKSLEERRAELDHHREELDAAHRDLVNREEALGEGRQSLESAREELDAAGARLAEESASLTQQQARLREKQRAFEQVVAAREQEIDARERELAAERIGVDQASRDARRMKQELHEQLEQLHTDQEELEREQSRLEQHRAALLEMQSRIEHASAESEEVSKSFKDYENRIKTLSRELAEAKEQSSGAQASVSEQFDKLHEEVRAARAALESAQAAIDESARERNSFEQALAKASDRVKDLEAQLESAATAEPARNEQALEALQSQLEQRRQAIELLAKKLRAAEVEIESLTVHLERERTEPASALPGGVDLALRRDRLHRIRSVQRARMSKLAQVKEALAAKSQEADRVLKARHAISATQAELELRERQLAARSGKNRGVASVFLAVLATLGLGAMSWAVVDRIVPATYSVRAAIAADTTTGSLDATQSDAWRNYCEQLVSDPRLAEVAAERMRRRGILEFGSAGSLSTLLQNDLDLASPAPNQLTLTLKGVGADRTELVLDTFVAALVSVANDARQRRMDSASTIVVTPPHADDAPIEDPRIAYAGIAWGASAGLVYLLALIVWVRLKISKRKFDEENEEMLAVGGRPFS